MLICNIFVVLLLQKFNVVTVTEFSTLAILTLTVTGFINLLRLAMPFNALRILCVSISAGLIILSTILIPEIFGIVELNGTVLLILLIIIAYSLPLSFLSPKLEKFITPLFKRKQKNDIQKNTVNSA